MISLHSWNFVGALGDYLFLTKFELFERETGSDIEMSAMGTELSGMTRGEEGFEGSDVTRVAAPPLSVPDDGSRAMLATLKE